MSEPTLEDTIALAAQAHRGQRDRAGAPYILHPLRMLLRLGPGPAGIAAVLHDLVEDTPHTLEDLRRLGYAEEVVGAVDALTRREGESYEEFITRAGRNPLARAVKIADLEDNLDLSRLPDPTPRDHERMERYRRALAALRLGS